MNCRSIDALLDRHATGSLSAAQRSEANSHLAACRRCADAWLAHETLLGERPAPARPGLLEATLAAASAPRFPAAERAAGRRLGYRGGLAAAAAAAGVLVLASWWSADSGRIEDGSAAGVVSGVAPDTGSPAVDTAGSVAGVTPTAFVADAPGLVAGVHYERLPVPAPVGVPAGNIEICEFFMFGCRHCFEFESQFVAWGEAQPDNVEIVRVPTMFNATARLHARAFYAAEALGELDALIEPFYEEIHLRGNPLASEDDLRAFFVRQGVAADRFDSIFRSFVVETRLRQADELNRRYRVAATPSIGVNGKYLTSPAMGGTTDAMLATVDRLIAAEAALCDGVESSGCPLPALAAPAPGTGGDLFR